MESLLRRIIGEDVALIAHLDEDLTPVQADRGQLSQVILNLAANARDAMPGGGTLTIETRNEELDTTYLARYGLPRTGPHVLLQVSDSGTGMEPETQAHIFEPFFTTKAIGKGTGLGLATVYGIVKQSGGDIWVTSKQGQGTTFQVYLPRADSLAVAPAVAVPDTASLWGDETILVVEDEASLRALASEILTAHGYTVLVASDGPAALERSSQHPGPIDLVLTDVVMPGMSGRQLAGQLATQRPAARILYMSGYTDDVALRHGLVGAAVAFVQKPFTAATLLQKVRDVLDEGEQPPGPVAPDPIA
jgi:CheY-like chemotaxis protein